MRRFNRRHIDLLPSCGAAGVYHTFHEQFWSSDMTWKRFALSANNTELTRRGLHRCFVLSSCQILMNWLGNCPPNDLERITKVADSKSFESIANSKYSREDHPCIMIDQRAQRCQIVSRTESIRPIRIEKKTKSGAPLTQVNCSFSSYVRIEEKKTRCDEVNEREEEKNRPIFSMISKVNAFTFVYAPN